MALRGAAPFDPGRAESEARRWLFRVAYRRAISALGHRQVIRWESLTALAGRELGEVLAPGEFEERVAERQALTGALAALALHDAACLLLFVVHEFTAAEAGQIVGASAQAVAKRFARAKQRLRDACLSQDAAAWSPETTRRSRA